MNKIVPFVLILFFLFTCKDRKEEMYKSGILGKWVVVASELNNKPSKSMNNAYFHFDSETTVNSNVFEEKDVEYVVEGKRVTIGANQPLELDISYFEEDSMVLEGNYSMYYIKFYMKRDSLSN